MGKIYTVTDGKTGQKKYPVTLFDAVIDGNGKKLTNRIGEDEAEIERLDEECVKAREVENVELNQGGNLVIVEDNLVSTNTNTALSANQGRVLKELIDSIPQGGGGGSSSGGASVNVVDNLLSTSSTSALSANQGRVLKGLVDGKQDKITATNKLSYSLLSGTPTIPDAVTEQTVEGWGFTKGYTKSEIDNMIGNIETLLAAI